MGKVKNENYFQVQGWMVNELGLKGNELMIYAIIYGFSQTDDQYFTGSWQYLADWTNTTKKSVYNTLNSLVEKGLLEKKDKVINKVKYCEYKAYREPLGDENISLGGDENISLGDEKISLGDENISLGGGEKISLGDEKFSPNNIENNNSLLNNKEDKIHYLKIVDMYNKTCVSFPHLRSLSDARKKSIRARLKTYTLDDFKLMFEKVEASSFLKGKNNRDWSANFDWMIKDANMAKILDGNYDDRDSMQGKVDDWKAWVES